MKKIIFEILTLIIIYILGVIYGYYNFPEPDKYYSWLISAVLLSLVYTITKIEEHIRKKKKNKKDQGKD